MNSKKLSSWILPLLLLSVHALFMIHAAKHQSLVWDEVVYPAAGYSYWKTGAIRINSGHGPLSKLFIAIPLVFLNPELPADSTARAAKDVYSFGFQFLHSNSISADRLIFWSRIPAVLFSLGVGVVLFLWIRETWSDQGGLLALFAYITIPIFLSRASLALLEMPMYFFMVLSLYAYSTWRARGTTPTALLCGMALGLALTCKLVAVSLLPTYFILTFLSSPESPTSRRTRWVGLGHIVLATVATVLLLYAPWGNSWLALQDALWNVRGFSSRLPYYFHERLFEKAPAFLSWIAVLMKAPLFTGALAIWGALAWKRSKKAPFVLLQLSVFVAVSLILALSGYAVSTVQLSPAYLGLAAMTGGLAVVAKQAGRWRKARLIFLIVLSVAETGLVHPNYLAYFNVLGGGMNQGYRWLADSDQDWGQALPGLARFLKVHPPGGLVLCYSGAGDPRTHGLQYQDLFSPALISRVYQGTLLGKEVKPIYLAIGTKVIQSQPDTFGWIAAERKALALVDGCFFVYDITNDAEIFEWMANIYKATNRPSHAAWAIRRQGELLKS